MNKEKLIQSFEDLKEYYYSSNFNLMQADIVNLEEIKHIKKGTKPNLIFELNDSISSARKYNNSLILVFSSAKNAGGGVLRGSVAQEEDISRSTSWYFQVFDSDFYKQTYQDPLYSSNSLYVKNGLILRDEYGLFTTSKSVSLIGIAAPNINGIINSKLDINENFVYDTYKKRLISLLCFAEKENFENIILGAWGCGVFGLNIEKVTKIMNDVINSNYYTKQIIFSLTDNNSLNTFKKYIK